MEMPRTSKISHPTCDSKENKSLAAARFENMA
jgi:hypothetical protein